MGGHNVTMGSYIKNKGLRGLLERMSLFNRKNFLINKPFQYEYAILVCVWLLPLSLLYPFLVYNFFDVLLAKSGIAQTDEGVTLLTGLRFGMMWRLILLQIVFMFLVFMASVMISHRIAGPLYKLTKAIEAFGRGESVGDLGFRKNDQFKEVADKFNEMTKQVSQRGGSPTSKSSLSSLIKDLENLEASLPATYKSDLKQIIQKYDNPY